MLNLDLVTLNFRMFLHFPIVDSMMMTLSLLIVLIFEIACMISA